MSRLSALLLWTITVTGVCPIHAAIIRRVVGPGDATPGVADATFASADYPEFDPHGNIRFLGRIHGAQITSANNEGFWRRNIADGRIDLLTRKAAQLPGGLAGETIKSWAAFGDGLALVNLTGPAIDASRDSALVDLRSETANTLVRDGQVVPGMGPGSRFDYVDFGQSDRSEKNIVFSARLLGPGITVENDSGLWVHDNNGLRQVVREGDLAPGLSSPFFEFTARNVDSIGRAAFIGHFDGVDPKVRLFDNGLYAERNGRIGELLRTSAQAPGLASGIQIKSIDYPRMNANGHLTVHVELQGASVKVGNDRAVYGERGHGLELLLHEGEPVPGLPNLIWNGWEGYFDAGPNALVSVRNASNEEWQLLEAGWQQIAAPPQHGDRAPGTSTKFSHVWWTRTNSQGQRVYIAELENDDDNPNNDAGIWAEDETGVLQLVIREGERVETQPGIFEPISFDTLHSELRGFNERGEVLFTSQGSVYLATLQSIPEPASLLLGIVGAAALLLIGLQQRRRPNVIEST